MTKVKAKIVNGKIFYIEIYDHANFANYGNDVVCAGISSVVFGALNAFVDYHLSDGRIVIADSFIKINLIEDNDIQVVANTLLIQLKTIKESYPDYIKIEII